MAMFSHVEPDKSTFDAAATQIWALVAGTKRVRILYFSVEGEATAAALKDVYLRKCTTAAVAGTTSDRSANIVNHDSDKTTSGVKIYTYTVNPTTVAAGGGILRASRMVCPAAATGAVSSAVIWDFTENRDTAPVISPSANGGGTAGGDSSLCLFLEGNAIPAGLSMYITVTFEEI
jgi:hypothetical protein